MSLVNKTAVKGNNLKSLKEYYFIKCDALPNG